MPPLNMIQCPGCGKSLLDGAAMCQFCGTDLKTGARAAVAPGRPAGGPVSGGGVVLIDPQKIKQNNKLSFEEKGYITISVLMIINGIALVAAAMLLDLGPFKTYVGVIGSTYLILGIGLIAQQTWAQFITKWCAVLGVVAGLGNMLIGTLYLSRGQFGTFLGGMIELGLNGAALYFINQVGDV